MNLDEQYSEKLEQPKTLIRSPRRRRVVPTRNACLRCRKNKRKVSCPLLELCLNLIAASATAHAQFARRAILAI